MEKVLRILLCGLLAAGFVFISCEDIVYDNPFVDNNEITITSDAGAAPYAATTISNQDKQGTEDGFDYELWRDRGTVKMVLEGGGLFSCEWSNIGNVLFRKGKKLGSSKSHNDLGKISIDYAATFNPNGNAYLCVYGWSESPMVEYYIIESWGSYRPTGTSKGTASIGGSTYDLYETTRTNQPSIQGNATFKQFWAVRQSKRTSGTIDVTGIFNAWYDKGLSLGKMYEVALTVEGYESSGNAKITSHKLTIGSNSYGGSSSGSNSGSSGGSSNNSGSGSTNTGNGTTTASGATRVEAENMTKGGQYTGSVSSPFNGVILYANDDKVSFSQQFTNNSHTFKVRGASSNSEKAQVQLKIGGTSYGTFEFTGTSATEKSITATHNKGGSSAVVELICVNDNNKWDVLIDWIEISASGSSSGSTNTGSGSTNTGSGNTNTGSGNTNTGGGTAATGSDQKVTFSGLKQASITSGITASVNSSGALSVSYTGQYKEVKYDLASNVNLANASSIVINASSPNGNTAVKFYDASGKEAFVQYNIKSSNAADTTITLSSAQKGNTIKTIGVMSQDTSNYSATVNSITFKGVGSSSSSSSSGGSSGGTATTSAKKYTFSDLKYASNGGGITYSVNSSGALSVTYTGQYKEVKYDLPSNLALSSYSAIVINASSPNGQTAVKFYGTDGKEAFVQYNIKSSSASDTTITLTSAQKGTTIKTIGIMSQDTSPSSYSATINSITFR